eukprot:s660_g25.t1
MQRSELRRLLLPASTGLANMMLGPPATAEEPPKAKESKEVTLKIGDSFVARFPSGIPSDDFYIGGGGDMMGGTQSLNSPKVTYIKPGGIAYGQGVRVGDEVTGAQKADVNVLFSEGQLRRMENVDKVSEIKGAEASPGLIIEFRARGTVQPGEPAPDFKLPASTGGELSLKELIEGNEYLVMFFRPSSRFRGGGLDEDVLSKNSRTPAAFVPWPGIKQLHSLSQYFNRAQKALAERGATVVGIQREPLKALQTQSKGLDLNFPLLCDVKGEVAKLYGAYIELEEQGPNTDRKTFIIGKDGFVKTAFVAVAIPRRRRKTSNQSLRLWETCWTSHSASRSPSCDGPGHLRWLNGQTADKLFFKLSRSDSGSRLRDLLPKATPMRPGRRAPLLALAVGAGLVCQWSALRPQCAWLEPTPRAADNLQLPRREVPKAVFRDQFGRQALRQLGRVCWVADFESAMVHGALILIL